MLRPATVGPAGLEFPGDIERGLTGAADAAAGHGSDVRGPRSRPGSPSTLPVARIAVDVSLPHLDRPFDYLVPDDLAEAAQPGVRVKVRFAGKDLDGFVLERLESSDHDGKLARIRKVVSPEQVLTPEIADLCRAVADRYAGVFADVTRLAVPPRHAKVEAEPLRCDQPAPPPPVHVALRVVAVPGRASSTRSRRSEAPRAIWTAVPGADWALAFAQAAAVCAASGRGALLLAPDARDLERLAAACTAVLGPRRVRHALGGPRADRSVPGVPRGAARLRAGGDRDPGGRVRAGGGPRAGRVVGRRRRLVRRATRAVSACARSPAAPGSPAEVRGAARWVRAVGGDGRAAGVRAGHAN